MLNKLLIALGLRKRPRRDRMTIHTYTDDDLPKAMLKLLQINDRWHQWYRKDCMDTHCEWIWYGRDEGFRLHTWKRTVEHRSDCEH